jgi:hypothetical protein
MVARPPLEISASKLIAGIRTVSKHADWMFYSFQESENQDFAS